MTTKRQALPRRQMTVSVISFLFLVIGMMFAVSFLASMLPGTPLDAGAERYPVKPGESAWQQFAVPICQPTRIVLPFAQPMLARGALAASYFVRDDLDRWSDAPAVTVHTTLVPGQSEVRLPFPDAIAAQRRLVRLQLAPESEAIAFTAMRDADRPLQYVTRRLGYLGVESLVFRAEYPGPRWLVPVVCVTGLQFPRLHPAVLIGAVLAVCAFAATLCGLAWRVSIPDLEA